jgi:DNA-binding winged helix-turn-helix (wHTH) protein/uncharacterized membrane protein HdeD (DUF308 family)
LKSLIICGLLADKDDPLSCNLRAGQIVAMSVCERVRRSRDETLPKSSEISGNLDKSSKTTYDCRGREIQKGDDKRGVAAAVKGGTLAGGEQGGVLLPPRCVAFGDFRFNVPARELLRVGNQGSATPISLGSRAADLLHLFLHRPGELITKSEIMDAVWPNMAVEESNLTVQISALRRALDGGGNRASYIQTVPGRGYRFTPRVDAFALRDVNGAETIFAGAAGALKADAPKLQDLRAGPESIPPSRPYPVVSSQIPVDGVAMTAPLPQQTSIWWLFWLQGMTGIGLGLMLLTAPGTTTPALVSSLGLYWLIMGILALVRVFVDQSVPWLWSFVIGTTGILAGISVARHPLLAALTVPTATVIVLGVLGLIMGVTEIVGGFMGGGIGSFILAVIYLPVGLFLLGSPLAAALAAPSVFGVLLLVQGVALTAFAFRNRT